MRPFIAFSLALSVLISAAAQSTQEPSQGVDWYGTPYALRDLLKRAEGAHENGEIEKEITLRQALSEKAWDNYRQNPKHSGMFDRWGIVFSNDIPLGLLLAGTHHWLEAESVFRHNEAELAHERLAGNDIKSENQLHLAQVLALEGKERDANSICSHWKHRMRHLAAGQDTDHWHGTPRAPLRDTPEAETASWDLACGSPEEGLRLLSEQIQAHPKMLYSYTVLSHYFFAIGDFPKALKAEKDGTVAITSE
jgi:hypothetical protein